MSRDILTVFEATVRRFDPTTGIATVVMPGPYGMEPIEAPPFAKGIIVPSRVEQLVVGDRVLVTQSENQPPEWLSANSDWMGKGDDRWVKKSGDQMSGQLVMKMAVPEMIKLWQTTPDQYAYMGFYDETHAGVGTVGRHGWVGKRSIAPGDIWLAADAGYDLVLYCGAGQIASLYGGGSVSAFTDINGLNVPTPNNLAFGAATRQMINLYSTTYGIGVQASTQYFRSAGGFNWYRGGVHNAAQGNAGGGTNVLTIRDDGVIEGFTRIQGVMRPQVGMSVWGSGSSYIQFYNATTDPDALGTRVGYVGFSGSDMYLNNENGVNTRITTGSGVMLFIQNVTEISRIEPSGQAWGRTIGTYNTASGFDIRTDGRFISSMDGTSSYNWMINMGAADVAGGIFITFRRGSPTAAQIGTITQVATTGVAFNQTSHGPWKGNVQDLDDDEALERLARWRPVAFQWKFDADGMQDEEGTPSGDIQHGFIAQELYEVQPSAVTKGYGVQTEEKVWAERKANHEAAQAEAQQHHDEWSVLDPDVRGVEPPLLPDFAEDDPFMPWGQDNSKLVPDMVAAMQAMMRQIEALQEEVALLRSAPGDEGR